MPLTERFSQALLYAAELHGAQVRKGAGIPYLSHLLAVAAIALEHGASEDEAIAALLHDAIEDQGGPPTRAEIQRRFGLAVAEIVDGCTDSETIPKPPWQQRKEGYLANLPAASRSVRLVCAADKLHNVRSLIIDYRAQGETIWRLFSGGRDGTLWYYRQVASILHDAEPSSLTGELARAVAEFERLTGADRAS